jgi:hypothetical protein
MAAKVLKAAPVTTLDWSQAPLEVRMWNLASQTAANWEASKTLEVKDFPGALQNPRWSVKTGTVAFSRDAWIVQGLEGMLEADSVKFESSLLHRGFGLDLQCRSLKASFFPGQIRIPMPDNMPFEFQRVSADRFQVTTSWNPAPTIDAAIRPLFTSEALEQSLKLTADCPASLDTLAGNLLRARFSNLPAKDPELYQSMIGQVSEHVRDSLQKQLGEALPGLTSKLEISGTMTLSRMTDGGLKVRTGLGASSLSTQAQALIQAPNTGGRPMAQVILPETSLNRLLHVGLSLVAPEQGYETNLQGDIQIEAPVEFKAAQLSTAMGELLSLPPEFSVRVRAILPALDSSQNTNPRVRPWVSSSGSSGGYDVDWTLRLEAYDPNSPAQVLATREVKLAFFFEEKNSQGKTIELKYLGGQWRGEASPELSITFDWALQHGFVAAAAEKALGKGLDFSEYGNIRTRRVGQASQNSRRSNGGYFAEALVVDLQLKNTPALR